MMMITGKIKALLVALAVLLFLAWPSEPSRSQSDRSGQPRGSARPITVPVTVKVRKKPEAEMRFVDLYMLREDGEMQTILSIRGPNEAPIWLAILIQDDLVSSIATETKGLADFVRHLPAGSRVMVGYI